MIPNAYIHGWSAIAPWPDPRQIEQDLIICRALYDLFNASALKGAIADRHLNWRFIVYSGSESFRRYAPCLTACGADNGRTSVIRL